jgi:hypothetical protein
LLRFLLHRVVVTGIGGGIEIQRFHEAGAGSGRNREVHWLRIDEKPARSSQRAARGNSSSEYGRVFCRPGSVSVTETGTARSVATRVRTDVGGVLDGAAKLLTGEMGHLMKVFIAGIDGYLGWPLAQYLAVRGHDIGGADNFFRRR